jgi:hypothetical protein
VVVARTPNPFGGRRPFPDPGAGSSTEGPLGFVSPDSGVVDTIPSLRWFWKTGQFRTALMLSRITVNKFRIGQQSP